MMLSQKSKPKQLPKNTSFAFDAIGTSWKIDIYESLSKQTQETLLFQITKRIDAFDKTYSRFRKDSTVHAISHKSGKYTFGSDFAPIMSFYRDLYDLTDGQVTPLVGNLLADAGYDDRYSFQAKELSSPLSWQDTISYQNDAKLEVKKPVLLDFGAAGKGYLVDLVGKLLEEQNIQSYCIDAGGDILVRNKQIAVGLEHPNNPKQVIGVATVTDQSICGSAVNRRAWGEFHHIFNPKTRKPIDHIQAVWTIADTAILADGLATALFFVEPKILIKKYSYEYVIVYTNYSFVKSENCPVQMYA